MAIAYGQVTLPSSANLVIVAAQYSAATYAPENANRTVTISNQGGRTIYLGDASVTTSTGLPVLTATTVSVVLGAQDALFGATTGGTAVIGYFINGD